MDSFISTQKHLKHQKFGMKRFRYVKNTDFEYLFSPRENYSGRYKNRSLDIVRYRLNIGSDFQYLKILPIDITI